jgi:allantoinase
VQISNLLSTTPAKRFNIANKGKLELGFDADLTLLDLNSSFKLSTEMLQYKHKQSPYLEREFKGVVKRTMSRGRRVFLEGHGFDDAQSQLVKPLQKPGSNGWNS